MKFLPHRDHVGPGPIGQGTAVGAVEQGTMSGLKQAPTVTQFGGSTVTPNTQTVVNEGGAWPRNPAAPELSPSAGRESQILTAFELHTGPAPGRILRQLYARIAGYTSVNADPVGDAGFPYNAEWSLIPHQVVPRRPYGPSPMLRQWDNNAPISAVYAGNPRGGQ